MSPMDEMGGKIQTHDMTAISHHITSLYLEVI